MKKTILIVEDNPSHMKLAATLLAKSGYAVLEAAEAESGLGLARSRHPDLVLMDIQLPGLDGIEATRRLKADAATRDIPVIAVTAYLADHSEAEMLGAGCAAIVAKPFHYKDFLATIRGVLGV